MLKYYIDIEVRFPQTEMQLSTSTKRHGRTEEVSPQGPKRNISAI